MNVSQQKVAVVLNFSMFTDHTVRVVSLYVCENIKQRTNLITYSLECLELIFQSLENQSQFR